MRRPLKLQEQIWFTIDDRPVPLPSDVDFTDYLWMAEELEEFDRQVEEEFWEELFLEACFDEMLAEEEAQWQYFNSPQISNSKLNPDAPVFVPKFSV
ncbi:polyadenylate-binding protein-interacting protein 2B-like [Mytilus edulis]|uniref:polyadenylate-binding protein-interacting protein 2B-like n=1 Tax=Mytilus edulis TaxID=6550 RepID=UPI0039EF859D